MSEFNVPSGLSKEDELRARFKITCRRCGSDDVSVNIDGGEVFNEHSQTSGSISIGCNCCKSNDWFEWT